MARQTAKAEPRIITIDEAMPLALDTVSAEPGWDAQKHKKFFESQLASCNLFDFEDKTWITLRELEDFLANFIKTMQTDDTSFMFQKRGLCVNRVADIQEFCESAEFFNQKGHVRPVVMDFLWQLFESKQDYIEGCLSGAIGWGKSYGTEMAIGYMIYLLSCYHNPQIEYDLAPGSTIFFVQQSKTLTLAKKVLFDQFSERLRRSEYFRNNFAFDSNIKSELRFPKQIILMPIGGSDTSALGLNVFGGVIDEMNFMARIKDSVETRYTGEEEYDQAERLYRTIKRRMKSRFMQKGRIPGKLLLISSTNYPGDFTSRKFDEAKVDKTILAISHSQWEALPSSAFSSNKKFLVEVGGETKRSRVLKSMDEAKDPEDVIEVPIDYKTEFERDVDGALRDLAGIATGTRSPFIPYRDLIYKAQETFKATVGERQLFKVDEVVLNHFFNDPNNPDWSMLVDFDYIKRAVLIAEQSFASHLDVGLSEDAAGLVVGRIVGYKRLPATKFYDSRVKQFIEVKDIEAPIYQLDGVLRITAPKGDEIDLELVRDLVLFLRSMMNIKWCTMDSYQAPMFYQAFRKAKIRSGILSVDTDIAPYTEYKLAVKDERVRFPLHEILAKETREIERDKEKDKIDHPPAGSKDVSDAAAAVCYILHRKEAKYTSSSSRRDGLRQDAQELGQPQNLRKIHVGRGREAIGDRTNRPSIRGRSI